MENYKIPQGHVLVMRTCDCKGQSHGGFQWPEAGPVEAPDWNPAAVSGNGLHGLLWGAGNSELINWSEDAKWYAVQVKASEVVDLLGKVKFPRGEVVLCGARGEIANFIAARAPVGTSVVGGIASAGYRGMAVAGYRGMAVAGEYGTAEAGLDGSASAGYRGMAVAGDRGSASAGDRGTASAGAYGTAVAGDRGMASAGEYGIVAIRWYDESCQRYRLAVGYVGEDGVEPDTLYKVENGRLVKAE